MDCKDLTAFLLRLFLVPICLATVVGNFPSPAQSETSPDQGGEQHSVALYVNHPSANFEQFLHLKQDTPIQIELYRNGQIYVLFAKYGDKKTEARFRVDVNSGKVLRLESDVESDKIFFSVAGQEREETNAKNFDRKIVSSLAFPIRIQSNGFKKIDPIARVASNFVFSDCDFSSLNKKRVAHIRKSNDLTVHRNRIRCSAHTSLERHSLSEWRFENISVFISSFGSEVFIVPNKQRESFVCFNVRTSSDGGEASSSFQDILLFEPLSHGGRENLNIDSCENTQMSAMGNGGRYIVYINPQGG